MHGNPNACQPVAAQFCNVNLPFINSKKVKSKKNRSEVEEVAPHKCLPATAIPFFPKLNLIGAMTDKLSKGRVLSFIEIH